MFAFSLHLAWRVYGVCFAHTVYGLAYLETLTVNVAVLDIDIHV